jgi:hypothetical protein
MNRLAMSPPSAATAPHLTAAGVVPAGRTG